MKSQVLWACVCGAVALVAALPPPLPPAPAALLAAAAVPQAPPLPPDAAAPSVPDAAAAASEARAKRSHGLLSLVANKVTGKIGSLSAASSGGHDHEIEYPPVTSFGHKSFDLWGFKKALFSTLLQAVKAIKGGLIALKGQLIKAKGHILTTKGALFKAKGEALTDFGRHIATKALQPAVHSTAPSSHGHIELSGPGEQHFPVFEVENMFSGWDLWPWSNAQEQHSGPSASEGYVQGPSEGHEYYQGYHDHDSNLNNGVDQSYGPDSGHGTNQEFHHGAEHDQYSQHYTEYHTESNSEEGENYSHSHDQGSSYNQYHDSGGGYHYQQGMGNSYDSGYDPGHLPNYNMHHEGNNEIGHASGHDEHNTYTNYPQGFSHESHHDSNEDSGEPYSQKGVTTHTTDHSNYHESDYSDHNSHDMHSHIKGHESNKNSYDHEPGHSFGHILDNLIHDSETHTHTKPSSQDTNHESDYFPNSILAHTSTNSVKPTSGHHSDNSGDTTLPVALPPLKHSTEFSIEPSIELDIKSRHDPVFPIKNGYLPGLGLKKPLNLGHGLPDFPLHSRSRTKNDDPIGPESYLKGETSKNTKVVSRTRLNTTVDPLPSEATNVIQTKTNTTSTTPRPTEPTPVNASSTAFNQTSASESSKVGSYSTNQDAEHVSNYASHHVSKRVGNQHGHGRKRGRGRRAHVRREASAVVEPTHHVAPLPLGKAYLPPHAYYGPPPSAPSIHYGVPYPPHFHHARSSSAAATAKGSATARGSASTGGEIKLPDGVHAGLLILKPLTGGAPAALLGQASASAPAAAPAPAHASSSGTHVSIQRSLDFDTPADFGAYFHGF